MTDYTATGILAAYSNGEIRKDAARKYAMAKVGEFINAATAAMTNNDTDAMVAAMQNSKAWNEAIESLENATKTPEKVIPTVSEYLDIMAERAAILADAYNRIMGFDFIPADMPEEYLSEYKERLSDRFNDTELDMSSRSVENGTKKIHGWAMRDAMHGSNRATPSNMGITNSRDGIPQRGKLPLHMKELIRRDLFEIGTEYPISCVRSESTLYYTDEEVNSLGLPNNSSAIASAKAGKLPGFRLIADQNGRNQRFLFVGLDSENDDSDSA